MNDSFYRTKESFFYVLIDIRGRKMSYINFFHLSKPCVATFLEDPSLIAFPDMHIFPARGDTELCTTAPTRRGKNDTQ